jgi:hypothetical protein
VTYDGDFYFVTCGVSYPNIGDDGEGGMVGAQTGSHVVLGGDSPLGAVSDPCLGGAKLRGAKLKDHKKAEEGCEYPFHFFPLVKKPIL